MNLCITSGEAVFGLWCEKCLIPAVVMWPLFNLAEDGVSKCGTMRRCLDCDPFEEGED